MNKREFLKGSAAMVGLMAMHALPGEETSSIPRENWSGTYHYHTQNVLQPSNLHELQDAVRSVASVRALGTRHSFNGIADSASAQIAPHALQKIELHPERRTVTVGSGVRYGDLATALQTKGWALANMASLPHISVAGSIATATHGSGIQNGNLATAVRGLTLVLADGSVRSLEGSELEAATVGLGMLGIAADVTLEIEPTYNMAQVVYEDLDFSTLQEHLQPIMGAAYSVSLFTHWQHGKAHQVWLKQRVPKDHVPSPPPTFYGAKLAKQKLHPVGHESDATPCTEQQNRVGPWYERLPHFRMGFTPSSGHEIQSEFFVPIEKGYEAIQAIASLGDRIAPHLFVTELRSVAADTLWMSMAYRQTSLAIHFTWKPEPEAVLELLPQIEAKLAPFHPRPHWAKVFTMKPQQPRTDDFLALSRQMDPQGKFWNAFLRQNLPL